MSRIHWLGNGKHCTIVTTCLKPDLLTILDSERIEKRIGFTQLCVLDSELSYFFQTDFGYFFKFLFAQCLKSEVTKYELPML